MASSSGGVGALVSADDIIKALRSTTAKLGSILSTAKEQANESLENFVTSGIRNLGGAIGQYSKLFTSLQVTSRMAVEEAVKANFRNCEVQEEFEELLQTETEWNAFLNGVEKRQAMEDQAIVLKVNDPAPMDLPFVESKSGETVTLKNYGGNFSLLLEALDVLKCRVLVIACGTQSGALKWIDEMNCSYPLLLDPTKKLYRMVGLRSSIAKTWNITTMIYYGEQAASNRRLPAIVEGDDPHQMGGDFIITNENKMALMYCSQLPPDRPSYETLVTTLKDIVPKDS